MSFRLLLALLSVVLFATPVLAEEEKKISFEDYDYDEYLAKDVNRICAACHGEFGEGGKGGVYPRLAGLTAQYLYDQFNEFKDRKRINLPMIPFANDREMPEEDLINISIYLSRIQLRNRLPDFPPETDALVRLTESKRTVQIGQEPGDVEAGKDIYRGDCRTCHGNSGEGKDKKNVPPLAGQHIHYLKEQIKQFQSAERRHEDAQDLFSHLSEDDVQNLMAYISGLDD